MRLLWILSLEIHFHQLYYTITVRSRKVKRSLKMVNSYKDKRDRVSPYWNLDLVAGRSFGTARHDIWEGLHPRACNLLIVMSGRCTVRNGRQSTMLLPGSVYLLAPAESRVFERFGSWDAYWVLFPLRLPLLWPEINPGIFRIQPPLRDHRMPRRMVSAGRKPDRQRGPARQPPCRKRSLRPAHAAGGETSEPAGKRSCDG